MIVWVVEVGEPLPIDGEFPRLMRAGLVAETLTAIGHDVTWWTSAFSHTAKTMRPTGDHEINVGDRRYLLITLRSIGYKRHMSPRRFIDHRINASAFRRAAKGRPKPDVIMVGMPTVELARAVSRFASSQAVPFVVDVRDLWPDMIYDRFPRFSHPVVRLLCWPMKRDATIACRLASGVIGITDRYVDWGVRLAGRPRRALDRSFSLAYRHVSSNPASARAAEDFWRNLGIAPDNLVFSFVGSLTRQFDFDPILTVARQWITENSHVKFVLAGQGPLHEELSRLSKGCSNVVLPGWIDAPQIAWLLEHSVAGLAPYQATTNFLENIPNKIVEYLSFGCPLVATLGDGLVGELVRDHGVGACYSPGNAAELADTLSSLVNDSPRRNEAAAAARQLFDNEYRAETVYGELAEHLSTIANSAKGHGT